MSLNKVLLIGHLGADPVDKQHYCYFHLATTFKSSDGKNFTSWHSIFCRGKLQENVLKFLKKGDQCYVEGRLNYQKNEDGKGQSCSITASDIRFLQKKGDGESKKEPSYDHQEEVKKTLDVIKSQQEKHNPQFNQNDLFTDLPMDDIPF